MSPTAIDNIRRGKTPSIEKLMCLAKYFNCSIDYLVGLTDNPEVNR
nr:helix-turn-helix transcriptional regulator [Congzhengia minquanensis]